MSHASNFMPIGNGKLHSFLDPDASKSLLILKNTINRYTALAHALVLEQVQTLISPKQGTKYYAVELYRTFSQILLCFRQIQTLPVPQLLRVLS